MIFDRDAFMNLVEGDRDLAKTLIDLFHADWPKTIDAIENAVATKNFGDLERLAHRIKGSVRNFFATEVAAVGETLELAGRHQHGTDLAPTVKRFRELLKTLDDELQQFLESP